MELLDMSEAASSGPATAPAAPAPVPAAERLAARMRGR